MSGVICLEQYERLMQKNRESKIGLEPISSDKGPSVLTIKVFDSLLRRFKKTTYLFTRKLATSFATASGLLDVRVWYMIVLKRDRKE
jgi:hypothetical protein